MRSFWLRVLLCLLIFGLVGQLAVARTVEFETTEVTAADVALSPDGQWLIFTILGHLFRLPVEGGTAQQLTFGPYYDTDPVFSPDGTRVAFVSDRDGSEGNIFVLELATRKITQITNEAWGGRPIWGPGGESVVYLARDTARTEAALVRRIALEDGALETVSSPPREFHSLFHLPDGRLGWTVVEHGTSSPRRTTRIEVMSTQGTVSTLRTLEGTADRVVPSPAGDGFYCRRYLRAGPPYVPHSEELLFLGLADEVERELLPLGNLRGGRPRFAIALDNKSLFVGEAGRLWKIALPSGAREAIAFSARVKLEIQDPVAPSKWEPAAVGRSGPLRSILHPRLSPDGRTLVFGAAGYLWQQLLDGGPAQRLFAGTAFEREPTFSPDGRRLAYVHTEYGMQEVRVFNFETRKIRTLASGLDSGLSYCDLSWSPDGERLLFVESNYFEEFTRIVEVNVGDGKQLRFNETDWWAGSRPHFSADEKFLYFSGPPWPGSLYRLPLAETAEPEPVTQLVRPLTRALVSSDGKWFTFQRNTEIWIAQLGTEPVKEQDLRKISPEGGNTFAFTSDGSALIYAAGNRVWRHPVTGGEREEIPIRLELLRPTPPPLLLRRVQVLDFATGGFGSETSLFIERGRIRWIGPETGRSLPRQSMILDARGRFAIPGLFDLHTHSGFPVAAPEHEAFIAYGITSVRDVGGWFLWLNTLADRGEASSDPVPRYFHSGEMFGGWWINNEDEETVRGYVRRWKEWGAQFIKVVWLAWPLERAVAEEARRLGLPVVGHGTTVEEIVKGVTLGYLFLEHTNNHNRSYDDLLQLLAAAGTRWDATLGAGGYNDLLLRDEPERLNDEKFQAFAPSWCVRHAQTGSYMGTVDTRTLRGRWLEQLAGIRAANRRKVKLHAGTDVGCFARQSVGSVGSSLHWELEHFVRGGLPPLEVLRIATQEAAEALGAGKELGTLERGKLADIVLLEENPLEDIRNTQSIWRVIKGGWLFDPEKLRPPESTSTTK